MKETYLTGGELTALTMVYWTNDPFQDGCPRWFEMAMSGIHSKGLTATTPGELGVYLTPKGQCLMDAINAIQEPVNQWVIP